MILVKIAFQMRPGCQYSGGHTAVILFYRTLPELSGHALQAMQCLSRNEDSRRIPIQPVADGRPKRLQRLCGNHAFFRQITDHPFIGGNIRSNRFLRKHTCRFIQYQNIRVFIKNVHPGRCLRRLRNQRFPCRIPAEFFKGVVGQIKRDTVAGGQMHGAFRFFSV